MMEKQNRTVVKDAAGDSGVLDDIVDSAVDKMDAGRWHVKDKRVSNKKEKTGARA